MVTALACIFPPSPTFPTAPDFCDSGQADSTPGPRWNVSETRSSQSMHSLYWLQLLGQEWKGELSWPDYIGFLVFGNTEIKVLFLPLQDMNKEIGSSLNY